jgi:glutamate--cysteine ligase
VSYVLDAQVMVLRDPGSRRWTAPSGLTFRDWVRGAVGPPPTADDLDYHMSTLFPPVRPRGHLELRVIDAQMGEGWIVPTAVVSALLDDPVAAEFAMAAVEPLQKDCRPGDLLLRAARLGQDDPQLAAASRECFAAADAALGRLGAPAEIRDAVTAFADRYVLRGRCPADDRLDGARAAARYPYDRLPFDPCNPDACLEESS